MNMLELSKRWTYPEHEGIKTSGLGNIDISRWARGATRPIRNEVGPLDHHFQPITSLRRIEAYYENEIKAKPEEPSTMVPGRRKSDTNNFDEIGSMDATFKILDDFWGRFGASGRVLGGNSAA